MKNNKKPQEKQRQLYERTLHLQFVEECYIKTNDINKSSKQKGILGVNLIVKE